jgi:hypothetical protein
MTVPVTDAQGFHSIEGRVTQEAIEALLAVGPLERLSVTTKSLFTVAQAKLVCALPRVNWLWLWSEVTRAALSRVIRMPGMETLDVFWVRPPGILRGFGSAASLLTLRANCYLKEADLFAISEAPGLRELGVQNAELTPASLDALLSLANLESLDLEATVFDDDMAHRVARSGMLRSLDIGATRITRSGLQALSTMKQLRSLDLWATSLREEDLLVLRSMPQLEYISLGGAHAAPSLDATFLLSLLGSLPSLNRVWLDGVDMSEAQLAILRRKVPSVRLTND